MDTDIEAFCECYRDNAERTAFGGAMERLEGAPIENMSRESQKLVDWLGTKEGQTQIGLLRSKVTRPGVPGKVLVDPKLIKYDALWAGENKKRIMSEWAKRFHK